MDKEQIKKELQDMTTQFCATFHACADNILDHPDSIPKEYIGKESQYIGQQCLKKVVQLTK